MTFLQAIIIAIVEGITEFLPISSTGHMIITESILGMDIDDFAKAFTVNIQFGAILSVIILYWKRFFQSMKFYYKLFIAFLPAAIIGYELGDFIDDMLDEVWIVAVSLLLGGIILLFVDKWFKKTSENQEITYPTALKIGFFQCIAMIPGVSRSAATIIGGMASKLSRKNAAEFSFFLAVPTMFAASAYKLTENYKTITSDKLDILILGNFVAFVVAMLAIKFFISFLTKYGFKLFGWYRIVVGMAILILWGLGIELTIR
ncbi:MAG: undecaprenyl-diphosphate phosphatase [Lentimicrobiaceae bacterium]|nr:undecaprenyl-diphosphate phosphatase [Lentimicrobiaceae bacterium]